MQHIIIEYYFIISYTLKKLSTKLHLLKTVIVINVRIFTGILTKIASCPHQNISGKVSMHEDINFYL